MLVAGATAGGASGEVMHPGMPEDPAQPSERLHMHHNAATYSASRRMAIQQLSSQLGAARSHGILGHAPPSLLQGVLRALHSRMLPGKMAVLHVQEENMTVRG